MIRLMQGTVNVLSYLLDDPVTGGREISRHRAIGHSRRVRQRHVVSAATVWQTRGSCRQRHQRWQVIATYSSQLPCGQVPAVLGTEPVISSGSTRRYDEACAKSRDWQ